MYTQIVQWDIPVGEMKSPHSKGKWYEMERASLQRKSCTCTEVIGRVLSHIAEWLCLVDQLTSKVEDTSESDLGDDGLVSIRSSCACGQSRECFRSKEGERCFWKYPRTSLLSKDITTLVNLCTLTPTHVHIQSI